MAKKLVSKTAKVLSETKKSQDREAIAIAYEHIPRNPEEQAHGSLYAVIEIEDASGHAEEIAESILDTLHAEYYEDNQKEPLAALESALAKINDELAERSGEGQINWLGKLNAILAVLADNTLHLTQAGKAEAYLYRGENSMHITEDLAGDGVNPLRTFINVASGELAENDKVALVTPGVFFKLSKAELKNYVTDNSPKIAVEMVSKILSGEAGTVLPNAVMLMEMLSPEAFASEPEPEVISEAWVKEEHKPLEEVSQQTIHGTAKALDGFGKALSGASAFITTKAFPAIKLNAKKVAARVKGFRKEAGAEQVILDSEERLEHPIGKLHSENLPEDESVLQSDDEPSFDNEIRIKETQNPKLLSVERFNFSFLKGDRSPFTAVAKKLPKGKNSIIYLVAGIILIGVLLGYLIYNGNIKKQNTAAESIYNQAKAKYDTAISEISSGQRSQALVDLSDAEKLANDAKNTKTKKTEAERLLADIQSAKEQASGVVKNTAQEFMGFGKGNLSGFFTNGKLIYGINYDDGSVYAVDPKAKTLATIVEKPKIDGKISFATLIVKRTTLVVYTDTKSLYEIDLVAKKTTKQTVTGGLEEAVAMASYNTNIYLLSPENNQIYKHQSTTSGYGTKTAYVSDVETGELTSMIDISIDSDVYAVSASGEVEKYTSGQKQSFNFSDLPQTLSGVRHIYVSADVKEKYVFTQNSIIRFDSTGKFLGQYVSDAVKDIKGIFVDNTTNTIFALSEGKIFSISL